MDILIQTIPSVISALIGAIIGGLIGYKASVAQWKRSLEVEKQKEYENKQERIVHLAYELTEYVKNYTLNSKYSPQLISQSGINPLKEIMAITVTSMPQLQEEVVKLQKAIGNLHGSNLPVPDETFHQTIDSCNEFGEFITKTFTSERESSAPNKALNSGTLQSGAP